MLKIVNDFEELYHINGEGQFIISHNDYSAKIKGSKIEFQASFYENYILFITEDIAYENSLYIYYFDNKLNCLDFIEISRSYFTDFLDSIDLIQPNCFEFKFLNPNNIWQLQIQDNPTIMIVNDIFSVVKRKRMLFDKQYLKLIQIAG